MQTGRHVWQGWSDNAMRCTRCGVVDFSLGSDDHGECRPKPMTAPARTPSRADKITAAIVPEQLDQYLPSAGSALDERDR